jgi:hypothetical protein
LGKVVEAYGWATNYLAFHRLYPDLGRMDEEVLSTTKFCEAQKRDVKSAPDRQITYIANIERHRTVEVMDKLRDFNISFMKTGIFVQPEVKADLSKMVELIHRAIDEHQINQDQDVRPKKRDANKRFRAEVPSLFNKIENAVAARLWDPTTTEV